MHMSYKANDLLEIWKHAAYALVLLKMEFEELIGIK